MIGPLLRILVIGLVLLVAAMFATTRMRPPPLPEAATVFETPLALPEFALTRASGGEFTQADFADTYSLLFFGFTNCPDICPLTLASIAAAYAQLETTAPGAVPNVVFVSVDSRRDTPDQITRYLAAFDSRFIGLRGDRRELDPLLRALGVTVMMQPAAGEGSYTVTHNDTIYIVGPERSLIATMGGVPAADEIVRDFIRVRALDLRKSRS